MITFRTIAELFKANTQEGFRVYVNQGGTSSGKTMTILDVLFFYAINEGGCVITIVGQDLPNLKVGSLRDARNIIGGSDWLSKWFTINESSSTIRGLNGSLIEFKSYDNAQDAKNGKRDYLFINEANGIPYDIYWQLQIRTRKKVYIDYNPSERFWVHDEVIGREGVKLIISDHRGNGFLTEDEHARIENIEDAELWRVYARGLTGKVQGLVLTNWDIVDELPPRSEWKTYAHGMDFGFSCFRGDTLIWTPQGEKQIKDIRHGDYVLTRDGYKRVRRKIYNGRKQTICRRLFFENGHVDIYATPEHLFNVFGKWKKYEELTKADKLCALSSSTAWSLDDTQAENTRIITTTNGKKKGITSPNFYITQFMKHIGAQFRRGMLYTTQTATRLIMILKTWLRSLRRSTQFCIGSSRHGQKNTPKNYANDIIPVTTGNNDGKKSLQALQTSAEYASGVGMNTPQQTRINVSAPNDVTTDGNIKTQATTSKECVNNAEKYFSAINTQSRSVVPTSVRIDCRYLKDIETIGEEICDVWDLEIEGKHEYFANGVLVHNCDPTALEKVVLAHGELWIDELIYETGLTNPDIVARARSLGITRADMIIADSAEPKSIAEIQAQGLWCVPSVKGADSIVVGLDILRRYKIHVTRRSRGLISNLKAYKWQKDRDGKDTNAPQDKNNHAIDAIRYVALVKFNTQRPRGGKTYVTRL